jgi:hypothetical protein
MTCSVVAVYVLCDLGGTSWEFCFLRRLLDLSSSYGMHDYLRGRNMQISVPGNEVPRSWRSLRWIQNQSWESVSEFLIYFFPLKIAVGRIRSRDSSVGIALGYGLDDRGSRVRFPARTGNFSLHHRVQNSSGAHPASYLMDTRVSFPGGKAAEAWSWPLTSI